MGVVTGEIGRTSVGVGARTTPCTGAADRSNRDAARDRHDEEERDAPETRAPPVSIARPRSSLHDGSLGGQPQ
ncbi:hypothetical protein GCM10028857_25160 [Salinarchaeum chitinilyticum]